MTAIKTILVPTDFSEASRHALQYACMLADVSGASLEVFHAVESVYFTAGYSEMYIPVGDVHEEAARAARAELEKLLTVPPLAGHHAQLVMRVGPAARELLAYLAERPDIDLVVMATHGRGGVARLMMGSVADKVVRAAPCPVLTIRDLEASAARLAGKAA